MERLFIQLLADAYMSNVKKLTLITDFVLQGHI